MTLAPQDREDVARRWREAMRRGDFEAAWQQTDRIESVRRIRQRQPGFRREAHELVWDGTPFVDQRVLVTCEHGLGDTLQFIRFVPAIAQVARALTVRMQPHLLGLFTNAPGLGTVCNAWTEEPPPPHDVAVEVMELAYACRCSAATLPAPYPHLAQRVRGRLGLPLPCTGRPRVGLLWAASEWDPSRSVPVHALQRLLDVGGVDFFSLQQGPAADTLAGIAAVQPLSRHTADPAAAADAFLQMDLVITIDGMPAHLAATLGRPTWLLLKHDADWRWMTGRDDTPWYPSMRLFRQPAPDDWPGLVEYVAAALEAFVRRPGTSGAASLPPPRSR